MKDVGAKRDCSNTSKHTVLAGVPALQMAQTGPIPCCFAYALNGVGVEGVSDLVVNCDREVMGRCGE